MFKAVFLLFEVSLLLVVFCFFVSFLSLGFVILFFQNFDVGLILLFFNLDLSFGFVLEFLLLFFIGRFILFKNFIKPGFFFHFFDKFFIVLHLVFLLSLNVVVLDCLDQFIESSVVGFSHFTQFAVTGLFQLELVSVIFFNSLPFFFVLNLDSGKFLGLLLFHSTDLFNLLFIFLFFHSLPFGYFEVPFVD